MPKKLLDTDILVVVLVGMEAGQKIAPHSAPATVFHILEGTGWFIINNNRLEVSPGATVIVPDGGTRAVEASTKMVFLGAQAGQM